MSHSTHAGFSCPPTCSGSCGVWPLSCRPFPLRQSLAAGDAHRRGVVLLPWLAFASPAVGVGIKRTASSRLRRPAANRAAAVDAEGSPRFGSPSLAVGVGHSPRLAIMSSDGRTEAPGEGLRFRPLRDAAGVGSKQPPAFPQVRRATVCRSKAEHRRDSVIHSSKVVPGFGEGFDCDVFGEDICGSDLIDDAGHFGPQVPRVVRAEPFAGARPWLAREPATDHVDHTAPGAAVEAAHVAEDRERLEAPVALPRLEHATAVGVELDGGHAAVAEQRAAEDPAANAGEQVQLDEGHDPPRCSASTSPARSGA